MRIFATFTTFERFFPGILFLLSRSNVRQYQDLFPVVVTSLELVVVTLLLGCMLMVTFSGDGNLVLMVTWW